MKQIKIIVFSTFFAYYTSQAIQHTPWYLDLIQETSFSYHNKCTLISIAQAIKHGFTFTKNLLSTKTYQSIKKEIAQKRLDIKNLYLTKEKQTLGQLGISIGFSQQQWSCCLYAISEVKKIALKNMQQPQDQAQHDQAIPKKLKKLLCNFLQKNCINPHSIQISFVKTKENIDTFALNSTNMFLSYDYENALVLQAPYLSHKIIIYEHMLQEPHAHQLAFLAHEVEHLYQQHNTTILVLEDYIKSYGIQLDDLHKNEVFKKLHIIHEEQAEIFAALKDPRVAQALVDLRATHFYPNHLYEVHYHDLVEINNLWKIEKLIDKIKTTGF